MSEEKCIFCEIVSGTIPASVVYNDEDFIAFLDITPVNHGHVLIVPKKHSRNIFDADDAVLSGVLPIAKRIATAVKEGIGAEGINIHMNNESPAGQAVFHSHVHVIPRFREDTIEMWKGHPYPEGMMSEIEEKIKTALK